jgi:hypothetical protein
MHTELDDEQIKFITDSVLEYLGYFSRDAMYRVFFYKREDAIQLRFIEKKIMKILVTGGLGFIGSIP